jgi:hypothetical protein
MSGQETRIMTAGACYHMRTSYHSALFTKSLTLMSEHRFVWVIPCHTLWKLRVDTDEYMVLSLPGEAANP